MGVRFSFRLPDVAKAKLKALFCLIADYRKQILWMGAASLCLLGMLAVGLLIYPMDVENYLAITSSSELQDQEGRLLFPYLNQEDNWCFARSLDKISPHLINATLAVEDQRFYEHHGVDPVAVVRAMKQNLLQRKIVSGASTITMQVTKFAHPKTRSLLGKLNQVRQAIRLDWRVEKSDLLEAYLNKAPYGMNLVGCEAASRRYFGKPASELTLDEAALLAGLPKAPSSLMPLNHPRRARQRRQFVLRRMRDEKVISQKEYARAIDQPLKTKWYDFPKRAPHFAMRSQGIVGKGAQLKSTLDYDIQERTEQLARWAVSLSGGDVKNAAAIVIDVSSASVLAHVGSVDFWDESIDGQVDCTLAERSPGSALKPFTYALAMSEHQLYSSEIILDDAWDKGQYNPENFDLKYKGLLTAAEALRSSRNVPAVMILERMGVKRLHRFLKQVNLTTLHKPPEHYGLGLTLGNCEVKLEELATIYTMLANVGVYRSLKFFKKQESVSPNKTFFSRGIGLKLYEMLEQPLPGELTNPSVRLIHSKSRVCWKTGTSQGYRDAWAFLFNRHYVVGVWLGNNDGRPSDYLVGARLAIPFAAKIFRSLPDKTTPFWPNPNGDLRSVEICSLSGLPATKWCPYQQHEFFPRSQYLNRRCDMHYPLQGVSENQDASLVVTRWPAVAHGWNLAHIKIPYISNKQQKSARSELFKILNPVQDATYLLTGEKNADRIQLKTSRDHDEKVYWYLNQNYLSSVSPNKTLYLKLTPGNHKLTCMNEQGEIDTTRISVETLQ